MRFFRLIELSVFTLFGVLILGVPVSLLTDGWPVWLAGAIGGFGACLACVLACKAGDVSEELRKERGDDYC